MPAEVLTKEDLEVFRIQLLHDIKNIVSTVIKPVTEKPEGFKTSDVRKMLGCSVNKLVSLRISRKLRTKKIGGTVYYNKEDIKQLLEEGY
jgi:hypothetical protein